MSSQNYRNTVHYYNTICTVIINFSLHLRVFPSASFCLIYNQELWANLIGAPIALAMHMSIWPNDKYKYKTTNTNTEMTNTEINHNLFDLIEAPRPRQLRPRTLRRGRAANTDTNTNTNEKYKNQQQFGPPD